jgi:hypothetical protein
MEGDSLAKNDDAGFTLCSHQLGTVHSEGDSTLTPLRKKEWLLLL